jgi:hypothetical protein
MVKSSPPVSFIPTNKLNKDCGNQSGQTACIHQRPSEESFWIKATTDPVAAFTGLLVVATVGLWFFTALMWKATKRAVDDASANSARQGREMQSSIAEAARAASAMEGVAESMGVNATQIVESVNLSRGIAKHQEMFGKAQMRAYISVLIGGARYQQGALKFEASPMIVNNGATPARNLRYRIRAKILSVPLPDDFRFSLPSHAENRSNNILGPQQNGSMVSVVEDYVDSNDVASIKLGITRGLYVWGTLSYEDIFGDLHRCTFAQQLYWEQSGPKSENGEIPEIIRGWHLGKHNRTN